MHVAVRWTFAAFFALGLSACGERETKAASPTAEGPAAQAVIVAGAKGEAPPGRYLCRIWQPSYTGPAPEASEEDQPYGEIEVSRNAYRLVLVGGGEALTGTLNATPGGNLMWQGRLGPIDVAPRRVSRARVTHREDVVSLVFDFSPATDAPIPHTQVICRMTVPAHI